MSKSFIKATGWSPLSPVERTIKNFNINFHPKRKELTTMETIEEFNQELKEAKEESSELFKQFKQSVDAFIAKIESTQQQKDMEIFQNRGWIKFTENTNPHCFLKVEPKWKNRIESIFHNNIENLKITTTPDKQDEKVNFNLHYQH